MTGRSDKSSMVWICLRGMELERIIQVRLIEEKCTLNTSLYATRDHNKNYSDQLWACSSSIWKKICFKLCIFHEHLQYSRWEPHGFLEVGTKAFSWEVPADVVVLSKARGENWPLFLLMVWLPQMLLFSPGGRSGASTSTTCLVAGGDSAPFPCITFASPVTPDLLYYHLT